MNYTIEEKMQLKSLKSIYSILRHMTDSQMLSVSHTGFDLLH